MTASVPCREGIAATGTVPRDVREAMLTRPKTCGRDTSAAQARKLFGDDHVHCLLLVHRGRLLTVVERADLAGVPDRTPAARVGRLDGRVVSPDADLAAVFASMTERSQRRLAVVDERRQLLGLLCLKRSRVGFCSDLDVRARAIHGG